MSNLQHDNGLPPAASPAGGRQFTHHNRAWYAHVSHLERGIADRVVFGVYCEDGGCVGEMLMSWHRQGRELTPRLEVFNDAWAALAGMPDLIIRLGKLDDQHISPEGFCRVLVELGFRDTTPGQGSRPTQPDNSPVGVLRDLLAKYDAAPDGPLGCGLTAGDFERVRAAVKAAEGSKE